MPARSSSRATSLPIFGMSVKALPVLDFIFFCPSKGLLRSGTLFRRPLKQRIGALTQPWILLPRAVSIPVLL
jgi:hypothetical protein